MTNKQRADEAKNTPDRPGLPLVSAHLPLKVAEKIEKAKKIEEEDVLPDEIRAIKKKRKVAIVGFAPSWYQTPFTDKSFDVWGINEFYKMEREAATKYNIKLRFDTWFEIHDIEKSPSKQAPEHQNFLKNLTLPLVTQKHLDTYPTSIAYPRKAIKDMINDKFIIDDIGSPFTDYSNQISWMLALAIFLGYEEIHVYGVDMAANTEYNFQRASCQYFVGLATGRGQKVLIPRESELCKHYCDYGFESDNTNRHLTKRRIKDLAQTMSDMDAKIESIRYDIDKLKDEETKLTTVIEEDIRALKADREKFRALVDAQSITLDFLRNSPNNLKEYLAERKRVLEVVATTTQQDKGNIEKIEQMLTQKIKERDEKRRHAYINIKLLEREENHLKSQLQSYSGAIGESKHLLANNIV